MASSLGHKKVLRSVEAEAYRQIMSGAAPATLAEFARQLLDWIHGTHPEAAPLTLSEVEGQIRCVCAKRIKSQCSCRVVLAARSFQVGKVVLSHVTKQIVALRAGRLVPRNEPDQH